MRYKLEVVLFGLLWLAVGFGYGASMGLALGWGSYTAIPTVITTVYAGAAYSHFVWERYLSDLRDVLFSLMPWWLMIASVIMFAVWGFKYTEVNTGWCIAYAFWTLALLVSTGNEAFQGHMVFAFLPSRTRK